MIPATFLGYFWVDETPLGTDLSVWVRARLAATGHQFDDVITREYVVDKVAQFAHGYIFDYGEEPSFDYGECSFPLWFANPVVGFHAIIGKRFGYATPAWQAKYREDAMGGVVLRSQLASGVYAIVNDEIRCLVDGSYP